MEALMPPLFKVFAKMGLGDDEGSYCLDHSPVMNRWQFQTEDEAKARAFRINMAQKYPDVRYEVHQVDDCGQVLRVLL
jgi:hypothetical protein